MTSISCFLNGCIQEFNCFLKKLPALEEQSHCVYKQIQCLTMQNSNIPDVLSYIFFTLQVVSMKNYDNKNWHTLTIQQNHG